MKKDSGASAAGQDLARSRRRRDAASVSRRDFLRQVASAGAVMAVPPLIGACGRSEPSNDDTGTTRTLFFNLAHESSANRSYFLEAAGSAYRLVKVADQPAVLAAERRRNAFLAAVPDDQITHHVEAVHIPSNSTVLCYVGADLDRSAGTWSMSGVHFQVHPAVFSAAAARVARTHGTANALFASPKRQRYGVAPATSARDLHDEWALLDPVSHAATLIGLHPEMMSLEPTSCVIVQSQHVPRAVGFQALVSRIRTRGAAMPQPNANGWGTLLPVVDPKTSQPARITVGPDAGRLQYSTQMEQGVAALAGQGMNDVLPTVKDDATLGGDVTPGSAPSSGVGRLWARRDGRPYIDHSPGSAAASSNVTMTLQSRSSQSGLDITVSNAQAGNGSQQVTVDFANWYLRYLGVFVQFLDGSVPPKVIPLASLPEYNANTILQSPPGHIVGNGGGDTDTTMFVTMINPITTIMGIPVESSEGAGSATMVFTLPQKANAVRILVGGLGTGSNNYPETLAAAAGMTAVFNYGFTAIFAAAGAAPELSELGAVISAVLNGIATELASIIADVISGNDWTTAQFWIDQAVTIAQYMLGYAGGAFLAKIVASIVGDLTIAVAEKAIPVAGLVMAAISAAIGAADLILTTTDIALSPWTYVNDLVFTYDLSVNLAPTNGLPAAADHYQVTAMFDSGTSHVQTLPWPATLQPVVFRDMPLGGNVNISAAFVQSATTSTADDILLGKGTSGLQLNSGSAQTVPIEQLKFPIGPTTTYRHQRKTELADSGAHVWVPAPAPTTTQAIAQCAGAGTICAFRDITVRQDVNGAGGFVGYAWTAQNSDPTRAPACGSGGTGVGQLDQAANLSTGADAQAGYAAIGCGIVNQGVRVAYSLLTHPTANFYLDPTTSMPIVRQVTFGAAPQFVDPQSPKGAWGAFNQSSDGLVLHPSGRLASINQSTHTVEMHRLPSAAVDDATAMTQLVAEIRGGQGTRPGRLDAPVAAAFAADGTLLVLEAGNNRIQAFDTGVNPVQHFTKQASPYFLTLDATSPADGWQYLDMAVEFTGFIYVLSFNANSNTYQMNLYHRNQSGTKPFAMATTMNAANLTVNFWRNVYTLNYETIQRQNPGNGTPAPVTEPSVSLWTPCDVGRTC